MHELALQPDEIVLRRSQRARRLALFELPLVRVVGSAFLSLAVFLHNRYLLGEVSLTEWLDVTALLLVSCVVAWLVLLAFYRGPHPRDLTVLVLAADMVIWTVVIYATGAEKSWLFFILLMRVADQIQTTFRRSLAYALFGTFCYASMLAWVVVIDGRPIDPRASMVKLTFILLSGLYISVAARTAESRRAQLTKAIRLARESIVQIEQQADDLREARGRAEEASAAKSEFLASMSHEMRTPLHGVIGMLQLAMDGEIASPRLRHLEMARRSASSLLGTIDDILDFAKIEARKLELEPVYFSLRELMAEVMKPLGVTAASKGLALAYLVEPQVPDSLWADPLRLRQIIVNLVGNSIKYTEAGEIAVRVWAEAQERAKLFLRFEVRDTGIGIEPEQQHAIFEPFMQVGGADGTPSDDVRRIAGGAGLGLSIVARLVEVMGGWVEVASQPGRGSLFAFVIAAETDSFAAAAPRAGWEGALTGLSVLVVDPHERSRAFMGELLRWRGIFATACASFDEAPQGRYACVIAPEDREGYPTTVLIGSPFEVATDDRIRITRPVSDRELIDAVGAAVGLHSFSQPVVLEIAPATERRLRLLVAEDNPVNQEFAAETLRKLGHEVTIVGDGTTALARLAEDRFDAVLMDVQMPPPDGLEVTRRFRAIERGTRTPILALTAHTRREDRDSCLAAGMDAVLTKPIDRRQVADMLRALVGAPDPVLRIVGGNMRLLARVGEAFAKQTPPLMLSIREAIAARDGESLYHAAHKLKGSVSNFPGSSAIELAAELESAASRKDYDRAAEMLPELEASLRELERKLAAALA
jgi:two-component system sensor histidine kinase/response regulator